MFLRELITTLEKMSYDELKDFIDYCEFYDLALLVEDGSERERFWHEPRQRRFGMQTGGLPNPYNPFLQPKKFLEMTTGRQILAYSMVEQMEEETLVLFFGMPLEPHRTSGAIAWTILRGKAPIRRKAEGNIQVKWIKYWRAVRDEQGKIIDRELVVAPYLYLRYLTVQGDSSRKTRRYKSFYIGGQAEGIQERRAKEYPFRSLTYRYLDLLEACGEARERTDKRTGEILRYNVRPKNEGESSPIVRLERLIMRCLAFDEQGEPVADYGMLFRLQQRVQSIFRKTDEA